MSSSRVTTKLISKRLVVGVLRGLTVMELGDLSQVSVHLTAFLVSCTTATRRSLSYPSSAISSQASLEPSGENVKPEIAPCA